MTIVQNVDATDVFERTRVLIGPGLRATVEGLPSSLRMMATYHFGWCDADGNPCTGSSGKAVRPSLALLACEAVGAPAENALPAAIAVELIHNYSLIHDDVMDADVTRRHRATVWSVFGIPAAILVGDAMLTQAWRVLSSGPQTGLAAAACEALQRLHDGQANDLAFERRIDVTLDECMAMAAGKTGALLGGAAELGARAGGGSDRQIAVLKRYGEHVGMAFQLVDDLLGIWGDPAKTGKPADTDLRTGKLSLPVVAALRSGTAAGAELIESYHDESRDLARIADLIEQAGGRAWVDTEIDRQLVAAETCVSSCGFAPHTQDELISVARFLARRET